MPTRKCNRCGQPFTPAQPHHRLCPACAAAAAPVGYRNVRPTPGAPAVRSYGGTARTTTFRRSLILRGDASAQHIIRGLARLLTAIYDRPTHISAILQKAAFPPAQIAQLNQQKYWNAFALAFCPELWEWLYPTIGAKARDILIDHYGLYGDPPCLLRVGFQETGTSRGGPGTFISSGKEGQGSGMKRPRGNGRP